MAGRHFSEINSEEVENITLLQTWSNTVYMLFGHIGTHVNQIYITLCSAIKYEWWLIN